MRKRHAAHTAGNPPTTREILLAQLQDLGIRQGDVLLVHTAFSRIAPIQGGVATLIESLLDVLGAKGTLVMPSMSYEDDVVFDAKETPCPEMGVVADSFWRLSGVQRSNNHHAFAALGPQAPWITQPHPWDVPHGLNSPAGRVYELGGQILLLGVDHDANTCLHLAENLAGVRYRLPKHLTILRDNQPTRVTYDEIDHCCQNFQKMNQHLTELGLQQTGHVGQGTGRLMPARGLVDTAVTMLHADETCFLHPRGQCDECDLAWQSLASTS